MEFQSELDAYIGSGTPLLQIISHEWERVEGCLLSTATENKKEYLKWSYSVGMSLVLDENGETLVPESNLSNELKGAWNLLNPQKNPLEVIKWFLGLDAEDPASNPGYEKPSILHLEDIHRWFDEEPEEDNLRELEGVLRFAARDLHELGRTVVLGTTRPVSLQTIEKEMQILELPLPDVRALRIVLEAAIQEAPVGLPADDMDELIIAAKGLTVMEAKVAYSKVIARHGKITADNIPEILEEKKQIIRKSGFLEFIKPLDKEVGGLDSLKEWVTRKKEGFDPKAKKFGLKTPKGILLVGFPGCGKSLTAMQTARTWKFPLLRFDIGTIFGGIVGESESNMREALKVADALAPCVLWVDEIEKGLAGSSSSEHSDAGTTSRVLATFLTWMQEKTAPVFVLATSNDISKMPPELTRKGRFDEIFFVDLPNGGVREEILRIKITENPPQSVDSIDNFDLGELVDISNGFTGAEIEAAVEAGMYAAYNRKTNRKLSHADMKTALGDTYPMYHTMRDWITELRKRKGTMYRSADSGSTDPLPARKKKEAIPKLTPQEMRKTNPFFEQHKSED